MLLSSAKRKLDESFSDTDLETIETCEDGQTNQELAAVQMDKPSTHRRAMIRTLINAKSSDEYKRLAE